jgi:hypothetical protein
VIPEQEQPWRQPTEYKQSYLRAVVDQHIDAKRKHRKQICRTTDDSKRHREKYKIRRR